MRRGLALAAALVAGAALAQPAQEAQAEGPAAGGRCALLGQVAVSEWLALLTALGGAERAGVDDAMARADRALSLYAGAACDRAALGAAMDCVLLSDQGASPRDRARRCLVGAGLAREQ